MSAPDRRGRPLALLAVMLMAVAGAACSDDGDPDESGPTSTTSPTTEGTSSTTEETDDPSPSTTGGDDDPTTSTTGPGPSEALAARLPQLAGYELDLGAREGLFGEELCDRSQASVRPVEETSADYEPVAGDGRELLTVAAGRFASEAEAATFYEEFTATTGGCTDRATVSEGTDSGIGEEGRAYDIDFSAEAAGEIYVSLWGDEVWILSHLTDRAGAPVVPVDAFRAAVEG